MGQLVDGVWTDKEPDKKAGDGIFRRADAPLRNWITADGRPGPSGEGGFKAEAGRYHLYVSLACPWAHRTLILRKLKGLEDMISVSVVHWFMADSGWSFGRDDGGTGDHLFDLDYLHQIYTRARPSYTGRVTVPVLWDKSGDTIVSNESSEIIRMLNSAFDDIGAVKGDYYPEALRREIDEVNQLTYRTVNNGVYKAGFADVAGGLRRRCPWRYSTTLGELETRLAENRFLIGSQITEADWRLFTTLDPFRLQSISATSSAT